MSQGQRRLAAIMFTDMVGYTALTQSNESRAMEVLEAHNRLLRPFFPKFDGKEIKAIGDSFLVEFGSALDALRCAMEIQSYLHEYNLSSAEGWKIRLRIGIHAGDVIHQNEDVFGDAVNISSRIEPLAEPEGICISRQVYDQVHNKFEYSLVSLGGKALKNVRDVSEVYSVQMPWSVRDESAPANANRVAVLPFSNMSPDPADEYFADGMTEELISTVSMIEGTEVISRTSVMQYKKSPKAVRDISRELDAGTVVEGSIRKAGNKLRVTVQLIDAARDKHLWAESYDRNLDDIFAIQSDIAGRVASALKTKISATETPLQKAMDIEAYTMFLRAEQLQHTGTETAWREAEALLNKIIEREPRFYRAHVALAYNYRSLGSFGQYAEMLSKSEDAAREAVRLAPESAEAHAAMAAAHMGLDRFEEARNELERAVMINSNLSEAYDLLGENHATFGRFEESVTCYRKALTLDPLSFRVGANFANVLRVAGQVDEALKILERMKVSHPKNATLYFSIGFCHLQQRDFEKTAEDVNIGLSFDPGDGFVLVVKGMLYALTGRRNEAEQVLQTIVDTKGDANRTSAALFIRASLGDKDEAFDALMRLAELHSWWFITKFEPSLEPLRGDPRFAEFCRKVGLPP